LAIAALVSLMRMGVIFPNKGKWGVVRYLTVFYFYDKLAGLAQK
jgi:hypothetical protein